MRSTLQLALSSISYNNDNAVVTVQHSSTDNRGRDVSSVTLLQSSDTVVISGTTNFDGTHTIVAINSASEFTFSHPAGSTQGFASESSGAGLVELDTVTLDRTGDCHGKSIDHRILIRH